MKHVAAYLLAQLGGNASPSAEVRLCPSARVWAWLASGPPATRILARLGVLDPGS